MFKRAGIAGVSFIVAVGLAAIAIATETPPFEEADLDKDGMVSQEEAAVALPEIDFAAADTDQNGVLTRSEYEAAAS